MSPKDDVQFLALLVHRGYLERNHAEKLLPRLKQGDALDPLLTELLGWDGDRVDKLRVTRAGEDPRIPGYDILGRLGVGGTSEVFRARDKKSQGTVALKILNVRSTRQKRALASFVEEVRTLTSLDHPGLCKGYGIKKSGDTYFAVLELIEGRTLLEHIDEEQSFPEDTALRIVLEVADVLAYLDREGFVHRDVKPGNIMLTSSGQVKLIDLGFCAKKGEFNPEGTATGTGEYLAPEQAMGGACADLRSDVYSLGATLFQMTVGRLPFEPGDDEDVLRKHVLEALRSPELKGRGFSHQLHYFIDKMMSKDADHRYQTWEELLDGIRGQLEGKLAADWRGATTSRSNSRRRT